MRKLIVAGLIILAAAVIYLTPQTPKVADDGDHVFGRTLCPWCPPVINKRISLSGEGTFVRPL